MLDAQCLAAGVSFRMMNAQCLAEGVSLAGVAGAGVDQFWQSLFWSNFHFLRIHDFTFRKGITNRSFFKKQRICVKWSMRRCSEWSKILCCGSLRVHACTIQPSRNLRKAPICKRCLSQNQWKSLKNSRFWKSPRSSKGRHFWES